MLVIDQKTGTFKELSKNWNKYLYYHTFLFTFFFVSGTKFFANGSTRVDRKAKAFLTVFISNFGRGVFSSGFSRLVSETFLRKSSLNEGTWESTLFRRVGGSVRVEALGLVKTVPDWFFLGFASWYCALLYLSWRGRPPTKTIN